MSAGASPTSTGQLEAPAPQAPSIADRLRSARVGLRSDIVVTRHSFRGEPNYVLSDPLTFASQRFGLDDYELLLRIVPERTLGEIFDQLVEDEWLDAGDEDAFYGFVVDLHRRSLLRLPIADDRALHRRRQQKQERARRSLWMAPMFFKRALVNPDAFLERTKHIARHAFGRLGVTVWALVVGLALTVVGFRGSELVQPLGQVFVFDNLILLWGALVGLKVVHELGHAYATKLFGGRVPEIGINLIVLTPLPYVDASAAWSFPSKARRMIVSLAGMYVELFFAAIGLLVWSMTEASVWNAFAYTVAFTGSVVTLLFNLNPLMKFDGYFVLADLLDIPNLRQRAVALVQDRARNILFGLPRRVEESGARLRWILITYGVSSAIYKVTLVLGIAAAVALRFPMLGLLLAGGYIGGELWRMGHGLYGVWGELRSGAAPRAHGTAGFVAACAGLPLLVVAIPLPSWSTASATVGSEVEVHVFAQVEGFLEPRELRPGQSVRAGSPLALVDEPEEEALLAEQRAAHDLALLQQQVDVAREVDLRRSRTAVEYAERSLAWQEQQAARREISVPIDGRLARCPLPEESGRFVRVGDELALITDGGTVVRAVMRDDELADAELTVGAPVRFRPRSRPSLALTGRVQAIEPLAVEELEAGFGVGQGGDVAVDPRTGKPLVPHFRLRVLLDGDVAEELPHGATGKLWIRARSETLLRRVMRPLARFLDGLRV